MLFSKPLEGCIIRAACFQLFSHLRKHSIKGINCRICLLTGFSANRIVEKQCMPRMIRCGIARIGDDDWVIVNPSSSAFGPGGPNPVSRDPPVSLAPPVPSAVHGGIAGAPSTDSLPNLRRRKNQPRVRKDGKCLKDITKPASQRFKKDYEECMLNFHLESPTIPGCCRQSPRFDHFALAEYIYMTTEMHKKGWKVVTPADDSLDWKRLWVSVNIKKWAGSKEQSSSDTD